MKWLFEVWFWTSLTKPFVQVFVKLAFCHIMETSFTTFRIWLRKSWAGNAGSFFVDDSCSKIAFRFHAFLFVFRILKLAVGAVLAFTVYVQILQIIAFISNTTTCCIPVFVNITILSNTNLPCLLSFKLSSKTFSARLTLAIRLQNCSLITCFLYALSSFTLVSIIFITGIERNYKNNCNNNYQTQQTNDTSTNHLPLLLHGFLTASFRTILLPWECHLLLLLHRCTWRL